MGELKILNPIQVAKYFKLGILPKRLEIGNQDKLVFIYDKTDEIQEAYDKWLKREI